MAGELKANCSWDPSIPIYQSLYKDVSATDVLEYMSIYFNCRYVLKPFRWDFYLA